MPTPEALIHGYLDGLLDDEQLGELERWICRHPDNADLFARQAAMHRHAHELMTEADIQDFMFAHRLPKDDTDPNNAPWATLLELEQQGDALLVEFSPNSNVDRTDESTAVPKDPGQLRHGQWMLTGSQSPLPPSRHLVIPRTAAVMLAALVVVLTTYFGVILTDRSSSNDTGEAEAPVVGRIAHAHEAQWRDGQSAAEGTAVKTGEYDLVAGRVTLHFDSGAELTIGAPASLELLGPDRVRLRSGKLIGHCPTASSMGFTVLVPQGRIVDVGTTFALEVQGTAIDVLVFDGEVVAEAVNSAGEVTQSMRLSRGESCRSQHGAEAFRHDFVDARRFTDLAAMTGRSHSLRSLVAEHLPVTPNFPYTTHSQGIDLDENGHIYWSFTDDLIKTNADGEMLLHLAVSNHQGDIAYHNGRLYCTVNYGQYNVPGGADSWIYIYDTDDFSLVERQPLPDLEYGAGAITYHDGRFFVAGGLPAEDPDRHAANLVYEYTPDFHLVRTHSLPIRTVRGIQTMAFVEGKFYFGCYGTPHALLVADEQLTLLGAYPFSAAYGLTQAGDGKVLFIDSSSLEPIVRLAQPSEEAGLIEMTVP